MVVSASALSLVCGATTMAGFEAFVSMFASTTAGCHPTGNAGTLRDRKHRDWQFAARAVRAKHSSAKSSGLTRRSRAVCVYVRIAILCARGAVVAREEGLRTHGIADCGNVREKPPAHGVLVDKRRVSLTARAAAASSPSLALVMLRAWAVGACVEGRSGRLLAAFAHPVVPRCPRHVPRHAQSGLQRRARPRAQRQAWCQLAACLVTVLGQAACSAQIGCKGALGRARRAREEANRDAREFNLNNAWFAETVRNGEGDRARQGCHLRCGQRLPCPLALRCRARLAAQSTASPRPSPGAAASPCALAQRRALHGKHC